MTSGTMRFRRVRLGRRDRRNRSRQMNHPLAMEIRTMKHRTQNKATLVVTCLLLASTIAAFADETAPADVAAAAVVAAPVEDPADVGPGAFLVLVDQVRLLRREVLELRLDRLDERIEGLERELAQVSSEMRRLDERYDARQQELVEMQGQLTDPELDDADREYLEAMVEVRDSEQSESHDDSAESVEQREDELTAQLNSLQKQRRRLSRTLDALRASQP
jgi:chaperonin cofactor prefoldin